MQETGKRVPSIRLPGPASAPARFARVLRSSPSPGQGRIVRHVPLSAKALFPLPVSVHGAGDENESRSPAGCPSPSPGHHPQDPRQPCRLFPGPVQHTLSAASGSVSPGLSFHIMSGSPSRRSCASPGWPESDAPFRTKASLLRFRRGSVRIVPPESLRIPFSPPAGHRPFPSVRSARPDFSLPPGTESLRQRPGLSFLFPRRSVFFIVRFFPEDAEGKASRPPVFPPSGYLRFPFPRPGHFLPARLPFPCIPSAQSSPAQRLPRGIRRGLPGHGQAWLLPVPCALCGARAKLFRAVSLSSARFRPVPSSSAQFRSVPLSSAQFRPVPLSSAGTCAMLIR